MVFMPHWPKVLGKARIDLGLDRVDRLLERLGNPHLNLPPVIHVAGTNGKGSTIAFLRSFLEAAGYRCHVYTSPHLLHFNERIALRGADISDDALYQICEECRLAAEEEAIPITFFEGTTVAAFLAFSRSPADVVLLETGLGGRLDATNVIPDPALTVITPISMDHMEYLGHDIRLIAAEKAGIIKQGRPCVSSLQHESADSILQKFSAEKEAPLFAFGYDWTVEKCDNGIRYQSQSMTLELPLPNLHGDHQIVNAATAVAACEKLEGFTLTEEHFAKGITHAKWPARLQKLSHGALVRDPNWSIWIDGAHNDAAAHILAQAVNEWDMPLYLIMGMTNNRDIAGFLKHFVPLSPFVAGVTVSTEPSAYAGGVIARAAESLQLQNDSFDDVEGAVDAIRTHFHDKPGAILCCGSLYLASDVMKVNGR